MIIAGLQKTTLVDYPGKVAATVFTRGCSFRCPFCHNPELVIPEEFLPEMKQEEILTFFEKRRGKLEGVCITGGEPLLFADTKDFLRKLKAMGYSVKLDSNGSFPDRLEEIIQAGLADYVAMDIKSPLDKYQVVTNVKARMSNDKSLTDSILTSIKLIMDSGIDYEFRTTIVKPLHSVSDFEKIGEMIKGAKRYYLQNFVKSKHINKITKFQPFTDQEITESVRTMSHFVKEVAVR